MRLEKNLTRCTSLNELADLWGTAKWTGPAVQKWNALRAEVTECLAAGGDLWEWESDGFRSFAGVCGLAVVRDGMWVREWQTGRS